jgi:hypothetical protein
MIIVNRRYADFEVIYDVEYRPMTNEEIYEGLMRSDFKRKKVPVVKSIRIARIARVAQR